MFFNDGFYDVIDSLIQENLIIHPLKYIVKRNVENFSHSLFLSFVLGYILCTHLYNDIHIYL